MAYLLEVIYKAKVKPEETGFLVVLEKKPGFWPPLTLNNYFTNTL
jgi:hypothetical protein